MMNNERRQADPLPAPDRQVSAPALAADEARPPLGPRRLHPAWMVIGAIGWLRALGLPLLLAVISGGGALSLVVYAAGSAVAVVVGALQLASWMRFRYAVVGDELRVISGLIARRERLVPAERIQAVDFNESLLQRLFGVVGVKIETAAGGSAESDVTLQALTRRDAQALRERLLTATGRAWAAGTRATADPAAGAIAAAPDSAQVIRSLSPGALVIAGATSGRIGPALALVVAGLQFIDDIFGRPLPALLGFEAPGFTLAGALLLLAILAAGAWLLAIAGTVLTFAGFELRPDGDRLLISHGLLDRRRRTVPMARIQAVRVSEGVLRQPFGLAAVTFESAGYGRDTAGSGVLFPLLRRADVPALLRVACPALAIDLDATALTTLPARARRRYLLAPVWWVLAAALLIAAVGALAPGPAWWWGLPLLGLMLPAAFLGLARYRDSGWTLDSAGRLIVRGRGFARETAIVARRRLQQREVRRGPLQRRARLATFSAAVAAGGSGARITVKHMDEAAAFRLAADLSPLSLPPIVADPYTGGK